MLLRDSFSRTHINFLKVKATSKVAFFIPSSETKSMQEIYFLARHTPFWAIPLVVLGAEFAYLFWLRKKKATVTLCLIISFVGLASTGFYVWAGGPERTVKFIKHYHQDYLR
jgi:hypothetical protein